MYIDFRMAVAGYAIAQNLTMAIEAGNEWKFPDKKWIHIFLPSIYYYSNIFWILLLTYNT